VSARLTDDRLTGGDVSRPGAGAGRLSPVVWSAVDPSGADPPCQKLTSLNQPMAVCLPAPAMGRRWR